MTRNCLIPGLRWGGGNVLDVPKGVTLPAVGAPR